MPRAVIVALIAIGIGGAQEHSEADTPTIGVVAGRFMDAWNRHDAHALAALFSEDADFTNVRGTHAHGRTGVVEFLAPPFTGAFKESHLTGRLRSIRFLKPDIALADIDWEVTGATDPGGRARPPHRGLLDWRRQRPAGSG
jgi:uncharacterized protein (TIGR02246 family)